jgi:hypothetical protein
MSVALSLDFSVREYQLFICVISDKKLAVSSKTLTSVMILSTRCDYTHNINCKNYVRIIFSRTLFGATAQLGPLPPYSCGFYISL